MTEVTTDPASVQSPARPALAHARFERDVVCLLGLPFDAIDLAGAVAKLRAAAFSNTRCFASTPNLNFLIAARTDPGFRDSVLRSDLSLPDGAPIAWMARRLGLPIVERIAGASVFEALWAHVGPPLTVFFFGGPAGVAEAAARKLNEGPQGLRCVGFDAAGFGSVEAMSTPDRIAKINRSGAQFVVVSLGAKKGQEWIERNAAALHAPLLCHLGAVVNFVAGTVERAPPWVQRIGLEWLWRITQEPHLWHRYWGDGTAFLRLGWKLLMPHVRRTGSSPADLEPCEIGVAISELGDTTIRLAGAWTRGALAPLRSALAEAVQTQGTVALRMARVSSVDSAFVGLLLLAQGSLGKTRLGLLEVTASVRSTLHDFGAGYLLDSAESFVLTDGGHQC